MEAGYQGSTHTVKNTSVLVYRIADKARELSLQKYVPNREGAATLFPDLRAIGRAKFESASLAAFNKKIDDFKHGRQSGLEEDEIAPIDIRAQDANDDEDTHIGANEWDQLE